MDASRVTVHISERVAAEISRLDEPLQRWAQAHLADPRPITVMDSYPDGRSLNLWLVTDHCGRADASYRVVFDPAEDMFGLIMDVADGDVFLGLHENFAAAVEGM